MSVELAQPAMATGPPDSSVSEVSPHTTTESETSPVSITTTAADSEPSQDPTSPLLNSLAESKTRIAELERELAQLKAAAEVRQTKTGDIQQSVLTNCLKIHPLTLLK